METNILDLGRIRINENNPRSIKEDKFQKLVTSLLVFPKMLDKRPIAVDETYTTYGGNMRYLALCAISKMDYGEIETRLKESKDFQNRHPGLQGEILSFWKRWLGSPNVPVVEISDFTEEEKREFIIKDNIGYGEWDWDLLANQYDKDELMDWGMDMKWDIMDEDEEHIPEERDFDEEKAKIIARCRRGDIWLCGDHRLLCGDSTSAEDVKALMGDERASLLFTSPPYSNMREYNGDKDLSVTNIALFIDAYRNYCDYQAVNLGLQTKECEIVPYWNDYIDIAHSAGLKLVSWNVWDKLQSTSIGSQKRIFPLEHEWIFVFGEGYKEFNRIIPKAEESIKTGKERGKVRKADGTTRYDTKGDQSHTHKKLGSVVRLHAELSNTVRIHHPATFPIDLPSAYIQSMTNEGDVVIEPFGGSGTTMIACELLGRKARVMELDEHYCDVILTRWESQTGKQAVKIENIKDNEGTDGISDNPTKEINHGTD